jgi:hypothetical protein
VKSTRNRPPSAVRDAPEPPEKTPAKKTPKIEIRCTEDEKRLWTEMAAAAGISLSDLVRDSLGRTRVWTAADRAAEQLMVREVSRAGILLVEIAKWARASQGEADALEIILALKSIEAALQELKEHQP